MLRVKPLRNFISQFSNDYEFVKWLVYVFLGGSVDALTIRLFSESYPLFTSWSYDLLTATTSSLPPQSSLPSYLVTIVTFLIFAVLFLLYSVPVIMLFLVPVAESLILTQIHPEKRIVPPLLMQVIAAGFLIPIWFNYQALTALPTYGTLFLVAVYTIFGGLAQDKVALRFTGITVAKNNIIRYAFEIGLPPPKVVQALQHQIYRKQLGLSEKVVQNGEKYALRSSPYTSYDLIIEIQPKVGDANSSVLILGGYEKGRYYLKKTDSLVESASTDAWYLKNIFTRNDSLFPARVTDLPDTVAIPIVDSVTDQLQGLRVRDRLTVSRMGWLKMVFFVGALIVDIVLFVYIKNENEAYATTALILLYLAFELPSKIKKE